MNLQEVRDYQRRSLAMLRAAGIVPTAEGAAQIEVADMGLGQPDVMG